MILANMNQFFDLDDHHRFFTDEPLAVCGSSCAMVQDTRSDKAFRIEGGRSVHYGPFPGCGNIPYAADGEGAGSCCCGGGCCWKLLLGRHACKQGLLHCGSCAADAVASPRVRAAVMKQGAEVCSVFLATRGDVVR